MRGTMIQPGGADDRATEFKAVEGEGEHFNGFTLMVEAYAAIWLILMVWLLMIWKRTKDVTSRVDGLERAIARAEAKGAASKAPTKESTA